MPNFRSVDDKVNDKKHFISEVCKVDSNIRNVTFLNPFSYNYFLQHPESISHFDSFYADGKSLVMLYNIFNRKQVDRVSFDFSSIADTFFQFCSKENLSVALVGGKRGEIEVAEEKIRNRHKTLKVDYCRNGYFASAEEIEDLIEDLDNIDVIVIGMGTPYQEKLAERLAFIFDNKKIITCGGFLTQTAIKEEYYWPIVKKTGLRWLQRAIMHSHVRKRLVSDYPKFFIKYVYSYLFYSGEK